MLPDTPIDYDTSYTTGWEELGPYEYAYDYSGMDYGYGYIDENGNYVDVDYYGAFEAIYNGRYKESEDRYETGYDDGQVVEGSHRQYIYYD